MSVVYADVGIAVHRDIAVAAAVEGVCVVLVTTCDHGNPVIPSISEARSQVVNP